MEVGKGIKGSALDGVYGLGRHKKIYWLVNHSSVLPITGVLPMYLIIRSFI